MKKKIFGAALAILMAACPLMLFPAADAATASVAKRPKTAEAGTLILDGKNDPEALQARIDARHGSDYAALRHLVVRTGTLSSEDCRFIRQQLTGLEELVVEQEADFAGGTIPRGAFEHMMSLRSIRADRAREVGTKAFALCEGLETVDLPNVEKTGVQAFAQAKGCGTSRLREVRMPRLRQMEPRAFYYCTNLQSLHLSSTVEALRPASKEGLWFERVTRMVIHVPSRAVYERFVAPEHCGALDWSAFTFTADNGDKLPEIQFAPDYVDADYDRMREQLLPVFDRTDKDFSGAYYTGDFRWSLNMYTFNMNINAWLTGSSSTPQLSTLDAIRWAADAGFDAVDVTCYYIPGYSNTTLPTRPEEEVLAYARQIRTLCDELGIAVSGTGLQNNFADPNRQRRETDVERIKFWIKVAHEMGAPVIRIFAGPPPADIRREGWEKIARERMVPHIREVAEFAARNYPDVRIGLQNHGGMLATANQVIRVLGWIGCDNVGIINDTGFYRDFMSTDATHYDWYRDIALVLPYSNNFQVKKKPAGAETSEAMDLERLMRDIRKSPYRGYIPVELLWVSKDEGYPGTLKTPPYEETVAFLKRLKAASEKTRTPDSATASRTMAAAPALRTDHPHILAVDEEQATITLLDRATPSHLQEQLQLPEHTILRVVDAQGIPRSDLEDLRTGDRLFIGNASAWREYEIRIKHYELENLALNPAAGRIKKSSFQSKSRVENAFDGNATGFSGSGWTTDGWQNSAPDRSTFWLAVDLGSEQSVDAFGVAWGTAVGQLKKRLRDGTYRVAYTNDPARWEALFNAERSGRNAPEGYCAPTGWTEVYAQNVEELPDANGNKVFIKSLDRPLKARYVMITGDLADNTIEIYNFFVFRRQLLDGAAPQTKYATEELALVRPDYPGMTLAPGRPALVRRGTPVPDFHVAARQDLTFTAQLTAPDGTVVYTSAATHVKQGEAFHLRLGTTAGQLGTYRMKFSFEGTPTLHEACCFTAVDEPIERYTYADPYPAFRFENGRLDYLPDYRGNTLVDYSHAGYAGGGIAIPNVPVKIILSPSPDEASDDTDRIQRAIDLLGRTPADADGFRGTLLLKTGTYRISRPVRIGKSGIVVRGEGDGHESIRPHEQPLGPKNWFDYTQPETPESGVTKVVATWVSDSYNKNEALFDFSGGSTEEEWKTAVTDQYVPVGSRTLHLADVSEFRAGDNIRLRRAVNAAWAQDLKMDVITDAPGVPSANQWVADGRIERAYENICQERTIASVDTETGTVTLTEPIVDPLDRKYGISTACRFSADKRVKQAGIENLQLISRFDKLGTAVTSAFDIDYKFYSNEQHAQVGVRIGNAEDIWVRRITSYHLDVAVTIAGGSRRITVQDVNCLEPVGGTGGERRYSFSNSGGSQVLNQRNYVRYTRHGFIVMGHVMGPNVFLDDRTDYQFDANEPHLRWSTGGLFDNMQGRIYIQNRWNNGTAHGWSGANYTLYNCSGKFIISQNPLAANYVFGQSDAADRLPFVMDEVDPGNVPNFKAHEQSTGTPTMPRSLYLQQLADRLGPQAVERIGMRDIPACKDESKGFLDSFAYLASIDVDGKPLAEFDREVQSYAVPVALDYDQLPQITVRKAPGTTVERSENGRSATFTVTKPGCIASEYVIRYDFVSKEPISGSGSAQQLRNLTDGNPKTSWSQSGSPCVQFYLSDEPVVIEQVSLGYCRNTQSRRQYYFDFEISDDGYEWKPVTADEWQTDNLGRGHIMSMQLMPGVGNNPSDYETFVFPRNVRARLLRIRMYGARFGRGSGTTNANSYWAIDVKTE